MKSIRHWSVLIGVIAMSLVGSPAALAADPPGPPPPHAAMQGHDEGDMQEPHQGHMQQFASLLHDALALRLDQEASWRTFMASMAPPPAMMHGDETQDRATLTTPQMLDRMAEHMRREQADFERHAAAVRRFYAVLSPTQQRTFDALMMLMHHGMGMHGMGGMEMHGMNMHEGHDDGSTMH